MDNSGPTIALVYYDDAYVEPSQQAASGAGLMGRHVAGKEFLDAYLSHGRFTELVAVHGSGNADSLTRLWQAHPANGGRTRNLRLVNERDFHRRFFPTPPASLVHLPCPPLARYAWARQRGGPGSFALCGVTHTLCPASLVQGLCELVTAPYETYDALICTSKAVAQMVRTVTGTYADYLRDRHGGSPALRVQLPVIPLGVNPEKFRPPAPEERAARRRSLHIADDEVAVLFVGRLSFHNKAHPFPMFDGLGRAARTTGRKVHLLLSGWTTNPSVMNAFTEGARTFAPGVRLSVLDGTKPEYRFAVWQAPDLFTSLSDNIQETFGLVILEAMASGLPVVASDWDGYRDLVVDGETGYLVPTYMVKDATADTTSRLLFGEIGYDQFLGECNQAVTVDCAAAAAAYARLLDDVGLRQRMGAAGRQRVRDHFSWARVVAAYEELWRGQVKERLAQARRADTERKTFPVPAAYPAPEESFAGYPTHWLRDDDRLKTVAGAKERLMTLLAMPLTNYLEQGRSHDAGILATVLEAAAVGCTLKELDAILRQAGMSIVTGRATLAWMLKYGLLCLVEIAGTV